MIRGYLVRKVISQVNIINDTLANFIFLISFCIKKKYFFFSKIKYYRRRKEKMRRREKMKNK